MKRLLAVLCVGVLSSAASAQTILIQDVRIFDGVDPKLTAGHVLVVDGVIDTVSRQPIEAPEGAQVIDGGNRVLSPGFIDLHTHLSLQNPRDMRRYHPIVAGANAASMARFYLDAGFTTIRGRRRHASGLCPGDRKGCHLWAPTISIRRDRLADGRTWRRQGAARPAPDVDRWLAGPGGRVHDIGRRGRPDADGRARKPPGRRNPDQDHGRRRRDVGV